MESLTSMPIIADNPFNHNYIKVIGKRLDYTAPVITTVISSKAKIKTGWQFILEEVAWRRVGG